ncbi:unnamed protein product [Cylindrotheca closterium]|uniref:Uncharacterized protein n=1 Tax=Cylindrotheca closterium TaxID=2856 RepID=A0AAD2G507_9STRA|nr:unnamed protein product [Cylindrotheca closterium]
MVAKTALLWATLASWSFGKSLSFTSPQGTTAQYQTNFKTTLKCRFSTSLNAVANRNKKEDDDQNSQPSQRHTVYKHLLHHFQGDFDNYRQVLDDRKEKLTPREGGGHENFHCTLVPLSETSRLAAFYFDGNPQRIFRFRYYELLMTAEDDTNDISCGDIEMKLYTLNPELERELRSCSDEPLKWPAMFHSFEINEADKIKYLPNCEIRWSVDMDPVEHAYTLDHDNMSKLDNKKQDSIHAIMVHGEAIVDSTMIPGVKIRILDQLSLYEDTFYINDRGLDPESGAFIYGNQRGVPYRLDRVTRLVQIEEEDAQLERQIFDEDLAWTMGESWRSSDEYNAKIEAIGGLSAVMSGKKPPSSK